MSDVDVNALKARIEALEKQTNEYKTKYQEEKAKNESFESEAANKSGDLQKQLELANKKMKALEDADKAKANKLLDQNIRNTIALHAKDAHDINVIINDPEYRKQLMTGIDKDNFTLSEDVAKAVIAKAYTDKPYLKKQVVEETIHAEKPKTEVAGNKDTSTMSSKEIINDILTNR